MKNNNRRATVLRLVTLLSAVLLLAVTWIVADDLFSPHQTPAEAVEIPDFRGMQLQNAATKAWMDVKVEYRYDRGTPAGVVLAQAPAAGSRRLLTAEHPTCEILLTVSLGEMTVTVPSVAGADAREAEGRLREAGLTVRRTVRRSAYPEGSVISQAPRGGEAVPIGTEIRLEISAGMPSETATVPDLVGLSRADALARLWMEGLVAETVEETDSDLPVGHIVRQSLPAGTRVAVGTRLRLLVSRGMNEE